jgi:hypothetical protein
MLPDLFLGMFAVKLWKYTYWVHCVCSTSGCKKCRMDFHEITGIFLIFVDTFKVWIKLDSRNVYFIHTILHTFLHAEMILGNCYPHTLYKKP